jgi:NagD protein
MDTDIRAGLEAGMQTILVLSGISSASTAELYPYRPTRVVDSIAALVGHSTEPFGAETVGTAG